MVIGAMLHSPEKKPIPSGQYPTSAVPSFATPEADTTVIASPVETVVGTINVLSAANEPQYCCVPPPGCGCGLPPPGCVVDDDRHLLRSANVHQFVPSTDDCSKHGLSGS